MVNRNNIYVLNKKDPDAIVYPTAEGKHIRITRDDFTSKEKFLAFKKWSDENFHEEENSTTEHPTIPLLPMNCRKRHSPFPPRTFFWSNDTAEKKNAELHPRRL